MINNILLVAIGGAFGSSFRYLTSELMLNLSKGSIFPLSTITVNVVGSLIAGILHFVFVHYMPSFNAETRLILMTGFLGGFTTFSAFSVDVLRLMTAGQFGVATSYIILSFLLSILAIFFGYYLTSLIVN